jgi:hypothetical protein
MKFWGGRVGPHLPFSANSAAKLLKADNQLRLQSGHLQKV